MQWETVIGLEIHAQLATRSKIFSGASTTFGAEPNAQACAVDLGLPGVLPVLNEQAVEMAIMFGLAVGATIARQCVFARKNYFYPDLPKGYQISQYESPIVSGGAIDIQLDDGETLTVHLTRAHLEEDAGKSIHDAYQGMTGIDLNRAGTPLLEIVSEPDMRSPTQAVAYMRQIHGLVRYLGICDGNMQEGSLRCDANVSVRPLGSDTLGTRTELKNLNSFRFMERAIEYEVQRQIDLLESGGEVAQETRLYDPQRNITRSMRGKEEANDYRYFPDPDLLPVAISDALIGLTRDKLPELPQVKLARFVSDYGLPGDQAATLTASRELAEWYEATVEASGGLARAAANWACVEVTAAMNRHGVEPNDIPVTPRSLAQLLRRIDDDTISGSAAKSVFEALWQGEGNVDDIIAERGLEQLSDNSAIATLVDEVIEANVQQVEQYRQGKHKVLGFLVGQVMKRSAGKANPRQVSELMKARLES